jgi:cobalt/nickel transport system permease protein
MNFSYIQHVDPRARIVAALLASLIVAASQRFSVLALGLAAAIAAAAFSGLSARTVLRRMLPLNLLLAALLLALPWTTAGTPLWEIGRLEFSREGLLLGTAILLKGNAIVLLLLALVGSMDSTTLGHALSHFRVPDKLTHLLLFTVRYLDLLHGEYHRLRSAMKVRGFRPRLDRHTYRSFGYLAGMLLVRSFERSERIVAAMKCRGFRGRFYLLDHFAFSRRDLPFCAAATAVFLLLVLLSCLGP